MKSAYPYTFVPPLEILDQHKVPSKTASRILKDQRSSQKITFDERALRQAQSSLELDEARLDGYAALLFARNAVTSQGTTGFKAPTTEAERMKIFMAQSKSLEKSEVSGVAEGVSGSS